MGWDGRRAEPGRPEATGGRAAKSALLLGNLKHETPRKQS